MYQSAKDKAIIIRKELKAKHDLNSKDVSVRVKGSSLSDAINVYIKSERALHLFKEIEIIAEQLESYTTDEKTGEILSGGNTFVFVEIDYDFKKEYIESKREEIQALLEVAKKNEMNDTFEYKGIRFYYLTGDKQIQLLNKTMPHYYEESYIISILALGLNYN